MSDFAECYNHAGSSGHHRQIALVQKDVEALNSEGLFKCRKIIILVLFWRLIKQTHAFAYQSGVLPRLCSTVWLMSTNDGCKEGVRFLINCMSRWLVIPLRATLIVRGDDIRIMHALS
jgi:hypothetical protein